MSDLSHQSNEDIEYLFNHTAAGAFLTESYKTLDEAGVTTISNVAIQSFMDRFCMSRVEAVILSNIAAKVVSEASNSADNIDRELIQFNGGREV